LRKVFESSRAVDVAGVCACVPTGRSNAQARSQMLPITSLPTLALTCLWLLWICLMIYPLYRASRPLLFICTCTTAKSVPQLGLDLFNGLSAESCADRRRPIQSM